MNDNLFFAVLAMDAYNRDYGAGMTMIGSAIGKANVLSRESLGITDSQYQEWISAGFYALAYKWGDQTVISYRGTDSFDLSNPANDVLNGWLAGIGKKTSQVDLALAF